VRGHKWFGSAALAGAIVALLAAPAAAHVTVSPSEAEQGRFTTLTFQVPNERPDAGTIALEINMPEDAVIPFVSVKPVPGFEVEVERRTLDEPVEAEGGEITEVVSKVTWTGGPIEPGQFQQFDVSAGPLPDDLDKLEFPALQTYEGGEVVRWIEEVPADGEEPEHPVPTLTLVASTGDAHGGGDDEATEEEGEAEEAETDGEAAATTDESSSDSDTLAIVALIVGGLGVVLGGLALIRRRTP
jgi:uncharacterized protein YcnI